MVSDSSREYFRKCEVTPQRSNVFHTLWIAAIDLSDRCCFFSVTVCMTLPTEAEGTVKLLVFSSRWPKQHPVAGTAV